MLLPHWWIGLGKLADLAAPAILECFDAAGSAPPGAIPVLLGVASPARPCRMPDLDAQILEEVEHRLGFRLHPASRVIPADHVSVVVALGEASRLLEGGKVPCVVVAAVDSLLRQDLVEYYLNQHRLLTPNNSNGFTVGEAGSAVLVAPASDAPGGELQILGMGLAHENATIESEEPLRGEGLTRAIREALQQAGLTVQEVQYRLTDLNGEHYKFKEMALAINRFNRKPTPKPFEVWHPIEYTGDLGAAIGPLLLSWALEAGQKGYGSGPTALLTLANDDGARTAIVARYQPREDPHE